MAQITAIRSMVAKDLKQYIGNRALIVSTIVNILFNLVFPQIYTFQVREIKVATVVHDDSELSSHIMQNVAHANDFVLVGQCATYEEALSMMQSNEADCIIDIPCQYEKDLTQYASGMSAEKPQIQLSVNAVIATKVTAVMQQVSGVISTALQHYAHDKGLPLKSSAAMVSTCNLYNPGNDYRLFMLPVLFISVFYVFSMSTRQFTNELQDGTIDQINVSPMSRVSFITSKSISSFILSMVVILPSLVIMWLVYGFHPQGNILLVLATVSLYVLSCTGIVLTICNMLVKASQMVLVTSISSLTVMILSGFMTPLECVAEWLQPVSYILPTRYLVAILRDVTLKGAGIMEMSSSLMLLSLVTIGYYLLAIVTFRKSRD